MRNFKDLKVWFKAHLLTIEIYSVTKTYPRSEMFALSSQMQRSASSIPTNIAEGCGHDGNASFRRYLHIALASASELKYQLILSRDLKYISEEKFETLDISINEIQKMIYSFIQKLPNT